MDEDSTAVIWDFTPLIPLRNDCAGEVVFTKKWQKLMGGARVETELWFIENESDRFPFMELYSGAMYRPGMRDARVSTSVINWLGTPSGRIFLERADAIKDLFNQSSTGLKAEDAYLAAWAIENKREAWLDRGRVASDYITGDTGTSKSDLEIMSLTMRWLGSARGQDFIAKARANIALKHSRVRDAATARLRS